MMNMDSFKKQNGEKIVKSSFPVAEEVKQEKHEKKENSPWDKVKLGFAKYLTKIFTEYGVLEHTYVKPLSLLEDQKAEIEENRQKLRMNPMGNSGKTKEQMHTTMLKVIQQFGWNETPPQRSARVFEMGYKQPAPKKDEEKGSTIFDSLKNGVPSQLTRRIESQMRTAGITEEELNKLPIGKLWELFQQKVLEKEIKEPQREKVYTLDEISEDFSILQQTWDEAYERMYDAVDVKRRNEVLNLTATITDPMALEEYIKTNRDLEPEAKFFIEMSINTKKFKAKGKELLGDNQAEEFKNAA